MAISKKAEIFLNNIVSEVVERVDRENPRLTAKARNAIIEGKLKLIGESMVTFFYEVK
jgi:hypothetical protein